MFDFLAPLRVRGRLIVTPDAFTFDRVEESVRPVVVRPVVRFALTGHLTAVLTAVGDEALIDVPGEVIVRLYASEWRDADPTIHAVALRTFCHFSLTLSGLTKLLLPRPRCALSVLCSRAFNAADREWIARTLPTALRAAGAGPIGWSEVSSTHAG